MDSNEKIRFLLRVARKLPEEGPSALAWADELLAGQEQSPTPVASVDSEADSIEFPVPVFWIHDGHRYDGLLRRNGRMDFNGKDMAVSKAGMEIAGYSLNGWITWKYRHNGTTRVIDHLRKIGAIRWR